MIQAERSLLIKVYFKDFRDVVEMKTCRKHYSSYYN